MLAGLFSIDARGSSLYRPTDLVLLGSRAWFCEVRGGALLYRLVGRISEGVGFRGDRIRKREEVGSGGGGRIRKRGPDLSFLLFFFPRHIKEGAINDVKMEDISPTPAQQEPASVASTTLAGGERDLGPPTVVGGVAGSSSVNKDGSVRKLTDADRGGPPVQSVAG